MRCRVRATASLVLFLAAQARELSLSGSLAWAKGALKRRARNGGADAAGEVLRVSSVFLVNHSVLVPFDPSSWLQNRACDRNDFFLGVTAWIR